MKLTDLTSDTWEFIYDHTEKRKQGIWLWYKGVKYPRRVYYNTANDPNYTLRALNALGIVKKAILSIGYLYKYVIPRVFSIKKYEPFLTQLLGLCIWQLTDFFVQDEEWSEPVWEVGKFVRAFLFHLGLHRDLYFGFAKVVMCGLEFDNAYRYRLQDIWGSLNKQALLDNPRKEIKRGFKLLVERDIINAGKEWVTYERIEKLISMMLWLLWIPKFKKAFKKAIEVTDFEKIKFDDNDRFHFAFWRGYDFEGKTFEQRYEPYAEIYKNAPFRKKDSIQATANFLVGL